MANRIFSGPGEPGRGRAGRTSAMWGLLPHRTARLATIALSLRLTILVLAAIALAPLLLASLRRRPTILCIVAAAFIPLPLAIPLPHTIVRFGALLIALLITIKAVQIRTGDETPRSWLDAMQF